MNGNGFDNSTHIISTPNARVSMTIDGFRSMVAKGYMKQITNYLGGDKKKSLKFLSAAVYVVSRVPKLLECDPATLIQSLMSCAEFELYPSNVAGEAFILPYAGKAQFQLGYQGLITLLSRAGISVRSNIVRKNDEFKYEEGLEPVLIHKHDPFATDEQRGEPVGVYAVLENPHGQKIVKVMGKEAVMKIREFSKAKGSEYSPWNSKQDPLLWMWMKTCIKQAAKLVPKTEVLQKAIEKDNEESIISDRANALDAGGPAVGVANHEPAPVDAQEELENALAKEKTNDRGK